MRLYRVVSISCVFLLVSMIFHANIVDAARISQAIEVDATSEHAKYANSNYNLGEGEIATNYDSWASDLGDNMPNGVFYGSNLEPNALQLDITVRRDMSPFGPDPYTPGSGQFIAFQQMLYFPQEVVMAGMYDYWVRIPIMDPDGQISNSHSKANPDRIVLFWALSVDNRTVWTTDVKHGYETNIYQSQPNAIAGDLEHSRWSIINGHTYLRVQQLIEPDTWYTFTYIFWVYETLYGYQSTWIGPWSYLMNPPRSDDDLYRPTVLLTTESVGFTRGTCRYTSDYSRIDYPLAEPEWKDFPEADTGISANLAVSFIFTKSISMGGTSINTFEYTRTANNDIIQIMFRRYLQDDPIDKGNVSIFMPFICPHDIIVEKVEFDAGHISQGRFGGQTWLTDNLGASFRYKDFFLYSASQPFQMNDVDVEMDIKISFRIDSPLNVPTTISFLTYNEYGLSDYAVDYGANYDYVYNQGQITDSKKSEGKYQIAIGPDADLYAHNIKDNRIEQIFFNVMADVTLTTGQWALVSYNAALDQYSYSHVLRNRIVVPLYVARLVVNVNQVRYTTHEQVFETEAGAMAFLDTWEEQYNVSQFDSSEEQGESISDMIAGGLRAVADGISKIVGVIWDGIDFLWNAISAIGKFIYNFAVSFVGMIKGIIDFLEANWIAILEVIIFLAGIIIALVAIKFLCMGILSMGRFAKGKVSQ